MKRSSSHIPRKLSPRMMGIIMVSAAVLLWSTVPVGTRLLVRSGGAFSVEFLSAARLWMAAILFALMRWYYSRRDGQPFHMPIRQKGWLFAAAAGIGLNYFFYGVGLRYTTASATSVITQVHSVATVLLAALLLSEQLTMKKIAGMSVAMAGVILVVIHGASTRELFTSTHFYGNMIEIVASMAWPFYAIGQTKLLEESDSQQALVPIFTVAAILTSLLLPFTGPLFLRTPTLFEWLLLIFLGVGSTAVAYWLFALALQRIETSEGAMFNVLVPPLALVMAYWLLHESFYPQIITGLVLVVAGLILIVWRRHQHAVKRTPRAIETVKSRVVHARNSVRTCRNPWCTRFDFGYIEEGDPESENSGAESDVRAKGTRHAY